METSSPPRDETTPHPARVLYVTSFGPDIYAATGKRLLESFYALEGVGKMFVCYEGDELLEPLSAFPEAMLHQLDGDPFLLKWLEDNRDIIPKHLGGDADHCDCPGWEERHARHKDRCHYQWMNRNASRWFRKVVSWRRAAKLAVADYIVWVDSDCVFKSLPHYETLQGLFGNRDVLYMRGKREAVESGILGFNMLKQGGRFIQAVCSRYSSGKFRAYPRWDDGYIVTTLVGERHFNNKDLVNKKKQTGNTVDHLTPWVNYLSHRKGLHGSGLGIMK